MSDTRQFAYGVGRLLLEPAMLLYGAVTFAGHFGMVLPTLAGMANEALWSGAAALVWAVTSLWLAWWTPRELVGRMRGVGRFWKWLGYSIGLGFISGMPLLVSGLAMGFAGSDQFVDWQIALISVGIQSALILMWVRVDAVAISGDRIRFAEIRNALSGRYAMLLVGFLPSVALSWAASLGQQWPTIANNINPFVLAGAGAVIQALAGCMMTAVLVAAYLEVDRSSQLTIAREVFE